MGLGPRVGFGCGSIRGGCGGPSDATDNEDDGGNNADNGGGPSSSLSYTLPRNNLGPAYTTVISGSSHYQANVSLGDTLSQGVTLSDKYRTRHQLSKNVVDIGESEKLRLLGMIANQKAQAEKTLPEEPPPQELSQ